MEPYKQSASVPNENLFELQIDQQSISYMGETARWAKFLSIVGFVMCGLLVIFAVFAGSIISILSKVGSSYESSTYSSAVMGVYSYGIAAGYIILALLFFFPCLYLFNFSSKMQTALRNNDQINLNAAFGNLKSCFKFVGILTIVILSFYLLVIIAVVSVASLMK
ncbi:hypothetical protein A4D02_22610 [Niastella koreensis]|uniref:Uncharacterized protein n=2 Tax=Niastella koreensis TaxID=354356 RepID=G8TEE6_NIAKG|nr:DUF5362 family protein [Niastella koreensis]AEV98356.1 hypothetical protein Niako_2001 [Niastella koreensis GR20-10]OQP53190.1 hypothetical protein A4D02_22610 [Niastella koreensis]